MDDRIDKQKALTTPVAGPVQKYIPPGMYVAIDEKYYQEQDPNVTKERKLKPHGTNVTLNAGFVEQETPISLSTGGLRTNYQSYIYNQITGFQSGHPASGKPEPVAVFF
jgi:hypothetical protein